MDFDTAVYVPDDRFDYGEDRIQALGLIGGRLHMLVFTMRGERPIVRKLSAMPGKLEPPPPNLDESPEWTEHDFARARPFKEGFPEQHASWSKSKGGRPPVEQPKVHIGFRLAADVVEAVKGTGKGYNSRVERVLREALAKGQL